MGRLLGEGFVQSDTLCFEAAAGYVRLEGEIACMGNIVITVTKFIRVVEHAADGEPMVQTLTYAYNAHVRNHNTFLRVDNAHPHPGHADNHHRHRQDWRASQETELAGSPEWIGEAGWPTLAEFVREVHDWYCAHSDHLPVPDGAPRLGLRSSAPPDGDEA
jgi:hypothetical protein